MATSIPKSFQAKIKHPIPLSPPGPAEPAGPAGPGPTPAPINFPHTFSEKLFQVPDGKTWQVLKLIVRNPSQQDPVEFLRVEKASSSGTEQIFFWASPSSLTARSRYRVFMTWRNMSRM